MPDDSLDILVRITSDITGAARAGEELKKLNAAGEVASAEMDGVGPLRLEPAASTGGKAEASQNESSGRQEPDDRAASRTAKEAASAEAEGTRQILQRLCAQIAELILKLDRLHGKGASEAGWGRPSAGPGEISPRSDRGLAINAQQIAAIEKNLGAAGGDSQLLARILTVTERFAYDAGLRNREIADRLAQLEEQIKAAHNP